MRNIIEMSKKKYVVRTEYIKKCPHCKCKFTYDDRDLIGLLELNVRCPRCEYLMLTFLDKVHKRYYSNGEVK